MVKAAESHNTVYIEAWSSPLAPASLLPLRDLTRSAFASKASSCCSQSPAAELDYERRALSSSVEA